MTKFVRIYRTQNGLVLAVLRDGDILEAWTPSKEGGIETIAWMVSTLMGVPQDMYTVTCSTRLDGVLEVNVYLQVGIFVFHGYGEDSFEEDAMAKATVAAFNDLLAEKPLVVTGEVAA